MLNCQLSSNFVNKLMSAAEFVLPLIHTHTQTGMNSEKRRGNEALNGMFASMPENDKTFIIQQLKSCKTVTMLF